MKLSSRKLCNVDKNRNRKRDFKLEVPLNLLKQHMNVCQLSREKLLDDILENKIDFGQYCSTLKATSDISDVKKNVEKYTKTNFSELKEKFPQLLSDRMMQSFVGAKTTATGQNAAYHRLVKHVDIAMTEE